MLATLVSVLSTTKYRLGAWALADYTLRMAGAAGRGDLKRRLAEGGFQTMKEFEKQFRSHI